MFGRNPIKVEAPEGEMPLGGGVTGPDAPSGGVDPNPSPPEPVGPVGADDQPGDEGTPADFQPRVPPQQQPRGRDNSIPYSRVREMVSQAERRAAERARAQFQAELQPFLEQFDPQKMRLGIAQEMLTAMGMPPKKPEPKYVTAEDLERIRAEDRKQWEQTLAQTRQQYDRDKDVAEARRAMSAVKEQHADLFEAYPDLEGIIANEWATPWAIENGIGIAEIADMKVTKLREALGKLNQRQAEQQQQVTGAVRPVKPGSQPRPPTNRGPDLSTDEGARAEALRLLRGGGAR